MFELIKDIGIKKLVQIEIILFLCVILSGFIHIYIFNSHFNIYFFEFLNGQVFSDFKSVLTYASLDNPYNKGLHPAPANYPPFAYFMLAPLSIFNTKFAFLIYLIIIGAVLFFTFFNLKSSLKINNSKLFFLATFIMLSHPFLFAIFRGNLDLVVGILLLNLLNFQHRKSYIPGILIGIAGAIKIIPLAFCIYFIAIRNFKNLLSCILCFVSLTAVSLVYYELSFLSFLSFFSIEYTEYKEIYVIGDGAMNFFSDPWLVISGFFKFLGHSEILLSNYYIIYNIVQIIWMALLTLFIVCKGKELSPIFVLLLIGMMVIGFPAPSNDYKILYMLPGAVYFICNTNNHTMAIYTLGIPTILLFLHYSFFYVFDSISISSLVRPIIYLSSMIGITFIILKNLINNEGSFIKELKN